MKNWIPLGTLAKDEASNLEYSGLIAGVISATMKTKRPGNPNWGKAHTLLPVTQSSFELMVKALKLEPHQYHESSQLKDWVQKNRNSKFVPLELLQVWGFSVKAEI